MKTPLQVVPEPISPAIHYIFDAQGNKLAITNREIAKELVHVANNFDELVFGLKEIQGLCDNELFTHEDIVDAVKEIASEMLAKLKAGQS